MSDPNEQLDQIREIRNMMERSSRFISLSGLSGVFAGFFALAGAAAFNLFIHNKLQHEYMYFAEQTGFDLHSDFMLFCVADAATVIILSLVFAIFFTTRHAKSKGQTIWDSSARRLIINLLIPLVPGGLYCLILLNYHRFGLVAPTTLLFYGLALVNASKYTLDEIRWLGFSEIILGLVGCLFIGYGVTLWALGFGIMHIIYGLIMYVRYETKPVEKKFW